MDREYTYKVLGCVYEVYKVLGPGLLESIYEAAMIKELKLNGFEVKKRLDLIIDNKLILELKSVVEYRKLFEKQLLTYLRLMNCEMGYVINFNSDNIRDSIYPVINSHYRKNPIFLNSLDKNSLDKNNP